MELNVDELLMMHLIRTKWLWAEMVMNRYGYGPKYLWTKMTSGPSMQYRRQTKRFDYYLNCTVMNRVQSRSVSLANTLSRYYVNTPLKYILIFTVVQTTIRSIK